MSGSAAAAAAAAQTCCCCCTLLLLISGVQLLAGLEFSQRLNWVQQSAAAAAGAAP